MSIESYCVQEKLRDSDADRRGVNLKVEKIMFRVAVIQENETRCGPVDTFFNVSVYVTTFAIEQSGD